MTWTITFHLAGYAMTYEVNAADEDGAIAIAKSWLSIECPNTPVEKIEAKKHETRVY